VTILRDKVYLKSMPLIMVLDSYYIKNPPPETHIVFSRNILYSYLHNSHKEYVQCNKT